jgi:hypothetical protein
MSQERGKPQFEPRNASLQSKDAEEKSSSNIAVLAIYATATGAKPLQPPRVPRRVRAKVTAGTSDF